jgi:hypothetical protein
MYSGSSNKYPIYGIELDRKTMEPSGTRKELYLLEPWRYGWHRFGEHMDNTFLDPFIEGAWMTKHNGRFCPRCRARINLQGQLWQLLACIYNLSFCKE